MSEPVIARTGIGRKFQKPTVFESHTVWDNLEMALKKPRGVFSTLGYVAANDDIARIEEILETIRLSARKGELAAGLSHGQKQWLEIGMLLAQDPKLLLVDEPVAGMTDSETVETAKLLKDIATTRSVVVVEHDMSFVRALGTRVTCLAEGSVLAEGTLDQVSANPVVIERYLGR
jgi:urea transport system ATP-binding protein